MNYEKPIIALVASAAAAIKGQSKDDLPNVDGVRGLTMSAYESDE